MLRSVKNHSQAIIQSLKTNNIPFILTGAGNLFESHLCLEYIALIDYYLAKDVNKGEVFFDRIAQIDLLYKLDLTSYYSNNNIVDKLEKIFSSKKFNSCIDLTYEIFNSVNFFNRYASYGENIGLITSLVLSFDDFSDFFNPFELYSYLIYLKSSQGADFIEINDSPAVKIMTIHQAKGLEFPIVFLPSQNERREMKGIHERFNDMAGLNLKNSGEERRVFYVACTRAEELLLISYSKNLSKTKKNYQPSKYLAELINANKASDDVDLDIMKSQVSKC